MNILYPVKIYYDIIMFDNWAYVELGEYKNKGENYENYSGYGKFS